MSNPTFTRPTDYAEHLRSVAETDAFLSPEERVESFEFYKKYRTDEERQKALSAMALSLAPAVMRDPGFSKIGSAKPTPVATANGAPQFAQRSKQSSDLRSLCIDEAREYVENWTHQHMNSGHDLFTYEELVDRCSHTVYAGGTPTSTLKRLADALPKAGAPAPSSRITLEEARLAVRRCGLNLDRFEKGSKALLPYPLVPKETDGPAMKHLRINVHADAGLPHEGKMSDPDVVRNVQALALAYRRHFEKHHQDVRGAYRKLMDDKPGHVGLIGKCKKDYYSIEKVVGGRMRFYNVVPKHMVLNMQVATQPFEALALNCFEDPTVFTAQGINLHQGGGERLVRFLEKRLAQEGTAYTHNGDDSWVVVMQEGATPAKKVAVQFALDCTSFDLTQDGRVTEPVHRALWEQLVRIDRVAADLWYSYMRERVVVTVGSYARKWEHGGPSGMVLQSKVNDVLMEVLLNRLFDAPVDWSVREEAEKRVQEVGKGLGFQVRLEQYTVIPHAAMKEEDDDEEFVREHSVPYREYLLVTPFLFIGYVFYATYVYLNLGIPLEELDEAYQCTPNGYRVDVCLDPTRLMAQLVYPRTYVKDAADHRIREVMRHASMAAGSGVAPEEMYMPLTSAIIGTFQCEARKSAIKLAHQMQKEGKGARVMEVVEPESAPWADVGPQTLLSLAEGTWSNWVADWQEKTPFGFCCTREPPPLPPRYTYVRPDAATVPSWADEMDELDEDELETVERILNPKGGTSVRPPPASALPKPTALLAPPPHPLTRGPTMDNDGRPAPTARWAPEKRAARSFAPEKDKRFRGKHSEYLGRHEEELLRENEEYYALNRGDDEDYDPYAWE